MSEIALDQFTEFRNEVISINRAFAGIRPLIRETRHLSLNAETSCLKVGPAAAAFSVVVKDLNQLSLNLGVQINAIERVFDSVVKHIGEWGKVEKRTALFEDARALMRSGDETEQRKTRGRALETMESRIAGGQASARDCLNRVTNEILRLNRLVTELNQVAVRQCRFIAISSMIEAQRVECEADGDLTTVAHDINTMAGRIGRIENDARDRILTLMSKVRTLNQRMN